MVKFPPPEHHHPSALPQVCCSFSSAQPSVFAVCLSRTGARRRVRPLLRFQVGFGASVGLCGDVETSPPPPPPPPPRGFVYSALSNLGRMRPSDIILWQVQSGEDTGETSPATLRFHLLSPPPPSSKKNLCSLISLMMDERRRKSGEGMQPGVGVDCTGAHTHLVWPLIFKTRRLIDLL